MDRKPERFEIFITRKGPVLITGESRIEILHSLLRQADNNKRPVELCTITSETKQPKSSVFNTLEGMVGDGVLRYAGAYGKKGYLVDSYRIIGSRHFTDEEKIAMSDIVSNIKYVAPFARMYFDYVSALSFLYGLDLLPIMKTTGHDFGSWVSANSESPEQALERICSWYTVTDMAEVSLESALPPTIKVVFKNPLIRDEMARVMGGFIMSSVAATLKKKGYSDFLIDDYFVNGSTVTSTLRYGDLVEDIEIIPKNFRFDDDAKDDFMMYVSKDGTMKSISSPLGLAVLEAMPPGKPISSADITASLTGENKKPQSSVLFYLEKMLDAGLVTDVTVNGKRKFVRMSEYLFTWDGHGNMPEYDPDAISEISYENSDLAFKELLIAFVRRISSLRIIIGPITTTLARSIAADVCECVGKKSIEEAMDKMKDYPGWFTFSEFCITSFHPFTIVRLFDASQDLLLKNVILTFDSTFFRNILSGIRNADFNSEYSDFSKGEKNGYRLVFEQTR